LQVSQLFIINSNKLKYEVNRNSLFISYVSNVLSMTFIYTLNDKEI